MAFPAFVYGLIGVFLASRHGFHRCASARSTLKQRQQLGEALSAALLGDSVAWVAYLLYSLGWLPGATQLQAAGNAWAAGVVTLGGGRYRCCGVAENRSAEGSTAGSIGDQTVTMTAAVVSRIAAASSSRWDERAERQASASGTAGTSRVG